MAENDNTQLLPANALLDAQKKLIEAQQEFIRLQQQLLRPSPVRQAPVGSEIPVTPMPEASAESEIPVAPMPEGGERSFGEKDSRPWEVPKGFSDELEPESQASVSSSGEGRSFFAKYGQSFILPLILSVIVVALLVRSPNEVAELREQMKRQHQEAASRVEDVSSDLKHTQSSLLQNQTELKATQVALKEAQDALRQTQESAASRMEADAPDTRRAAVEEQEPVAGRVAAKAERASDSVSDSPVALAQSQLKSARMALNANRQALINNLREYRETARALSLALRDVERIHLHQKVVKGELTEDEVEQQLRSAEEFMPARAKALLKDPRLDEGSAVRAGEIGEMPSTLPEIQSLQIKTVRELSATQKELRDTQSLISGTQDRLRSAQSELVKAQKEIEEKSMGSSPPQMAPARPAARPASAESATDIRKKP